MSDEKNFTPKNFQEKNLPEFTMTALLLGIVMCIFFSATTFYFTLKMGMAIIVAYPAALIAKAIFNSIQGNILEENISRIIATTGDHIAASAFFTLILFFNLDLMSPKSFFTWKSYFIFTVLITSGAMLGIMIATIFRRLMVTDQSFLFPESIAIGIIHKPSLVMKYLENQVLQNISNKIKRLQNSFYILVGMLVGLMIQIAGYIRFYAESQNFIPLIKSTMEDKFGETIIRIRTGIMINIPNASPAYMGLGYIMGIKLASLLFCGGILGWMFIIPILLYIYSSDMNLPSIINGASIEEIENVWRVWQTAYLDQWRFSVRTIGVGAIFASVVFFLFKMINKIFLNSLANKEFSDHPSNKSFSSDELRKTEDISNFSTKEENERDFPSHKIRTIIFASVLIICCLFSFYLLIDKENNNYSTIAKVAIAISMTFIVLISCFIFSLISSYIASSLGAVNIPLTALTLAFIIIVIPIFSIFGIKGDIAIALILFMAAIVCTSSAVAANTMQDFKVGNILGATPWKMQIASIVGVIVAVNVIFGTFALLFRDYPIFPMTFPKTVQKFIFEGVDWTYICVGIFIGFGSILLRIRNSVLIGVGMYLPLDMSLVIFLGAFAKWLLDKICYNSNNGYSSSKVFEVENTINSKQDNNEDPPNTRIVRATNIGILLSSGLILGEALAGLFFSIYFLCGGRYFSIFNEPSSLISIGILIGISFLLVFVPLDNSADN